MGKKKEKDKESLSEVSPAILTTVMKSRDADVKETKYESDKIASHSDLDGDELRKKKQKKKHKKMSIDPQAEDSNNVLFTKNKKKKNKRKRGDYQEHLNDCIAIENKSEKIIINNSSRSLEKLNELDTNSKDYQEVIKTKRKKKKKNHDRDQFQSKPDNSSGDVMYSIADLSEMSTKSKKKKKKHKRDHYQKELTDYNAVDNKSEKNLDNHASGPLEILNEPDINCKDYQAGIETKRKKKKVNHDRDQFQRKPDDSYGDVMYSIADLSEMSKKSKKKKKKHKRDHYQKELTDYNAVDNKSEKNLDNH